MPNHQMLDNITHQNVRVMTAQHPRFGDTQSYTKVVLSELKLAQSEYPMFLRKNSDTGQFEIIALFGFDAEENLFLDEQGWHAHYLPLTIARRPFLIGFQDQQGAPQPVVHIDMDSPRISDSEGEAVFLPQGGQSPYLQHISSVLQAIHEGHQQTELFVNTLMAQELIEPVNLNVTLDNEAQFELPGLYTINEENLQDLDGTELAALHQQGYLEAIYMLVASTHNLTKLIERKNQRLP